MGLLDDFLDFAKTPEGQGVMSGIAGYAMNAQRGTPFNNLGRGAMAGLMGYGQAQNMADKRLEEAQQRKMRDLQMGQLQGQIDDQNKVRDFYGNLGKFNVSPIQQALSNGQGPTIANEAQIPKMAGGFNAKSMYEAMLNSGSPTLAQAGLAGLTKKPDMHKLGYGEKLIDAEGKIFAEGGPDPYKMSKSEELRQRHLDRLAEIQASSSMAAANRPEKMVTVMDEDGNPFSIPQSQAFAEKLPIYSAAAAKALKEKTAAKGAKQQLTDAASEIRSYYDDLKSGGGVTSSEVGALGNIGARIGTSSVGRTVGSYLGTKNEESRQKIEQARPLLLNLIKQATGMSSQQMNSNVELQTYLKAATDPTLTYEANVQALNNLDRMFGIGVGIESKPNAQKSSIGSGGWSATKVGK